MKQEWEVFFDGHAERYDENPFTFHTSTEIDFFLELFPLTPGSSILDVGCGTGRHSLEFARRGFSVTGVDLSKGMLEVASRKAKAADLSIQFLHADATTMDLGASFDAAICLCEGGLGLIGSTTDPVIHDQAILTSICAHLRPGAPFLMTTLNGYSVIRQMKDEMTAEGKFDPATMVSVYADEWDLPEGKRWIQIRERLFIPPEMVRMLEVAGFRCDAVYGGTAGHWGKRQLSLDEIEAMYVCTKA